MVQTLNAHRTIGDVQFIHQNQIFSIREGKPQNVVNANNRYQLTEYCKPQNPDRYQGRVRKRCYFCGRLDHFTDECKRGRTATYKCFNCDMPGHFKRDCTANNVLEDISCKIINLFKRDDHDDNRRRNYDKSRSQPEKQPDEQPGEEHNRTKSWTSRRPRIDEPPVTTNHPTHDEQ